MNFREVTAVIEFPVLWMPWCHSYLYKSISRLVVVIFTEAIFWGIIVIVFKRYTSFKHILATSRFNCFLETLEKNDSQTDRGFTILAKEIKKVQFMKFIIPPRGKKKQTNNYTSYQTETSWLEQFDESLCPAVRRIAAVNWEEQFFFCWLP